MLTRTAIYEGTIKAGHEEEFFRRVRDELEPMWRRFLHVKAVRPADHHRRQVLPADRHDSRDGFRGHEGH